MVPASLYSLYLTLYKTDISLRLTLTAGPKGVRLRGSWLVFLMLRNNADVRRCSYFDLGLSVEKPWPYRFFSFFRPWFSFRAAVSLTLRITKEKNTPKSRQLSKPTEKPGRSRLLEPRSNVFYRRRDDLIHDHHQRITWHSSSKLVIPEWSHVTSLRLCILSWYIFFGPDLICRFAFACWR